MPRANRARGRPMPTELRLRFPPVIRPDSSLLRADPQLQESPGAAGVPLRDVRSPPPFAHARCAIASRTRRSLPATLRAANGVARVRKHLLADGHRSGRSADRGYRVQPRDGGAYTPL